MSEILNFDLLKSDSNTTSLNPDAVFKVLQQIPNDTIYEYDIEVKKYLDEKILFSNILISIDNPNICRLHIDKLSQDQLNKFCQLILCLSSNDVLNKTFEILKHGADILNFSEEVKEKAYVTLKKIKESKISHKKIAKLTQQFLKLKTLVWCIEETESYNLEVAGEKLLIDQICVLECADDLIELIDNSEFKNFVSGDLK
jgi:hypothetical protein